MAEGNSLERRGFQPPPFYVGGCAKLECRPSSPDSVGICRTVVLESL